MRTLASLYKRFRYVIPRATAQGGYAQSRTLEVERCCGYDRLDTGEMRMQTIGLIGVGRIGTEIAKHLIGGGYRVLGYRRSSLAEYEKLGGVPAESPAQVGAEADIVFSCLPGGDSLDDVINGPHGLMHSARNGQIVAELGSHALAAKERQVERLARRGAIFLDGEVSGTPGMVAQRKAPVYLAGDAAACQAIEPVVGAFTDLYLYLGAFGAASTVKFVNNLLVTVNTAAIGEAVSLALKAGVDPQMMIKAITNGSGGSVLFPIRAPRMVARNFLPAQGTFEMLSHYFEYIDGLAERTGASTPLFDLASTLYRQGIERGLGEHDVAAIIEVIEEKAGESKARKAN
jgi:3-hydroxyisobutyrate dehydrogenase